MSDNSLRGHLIVQNGGEWVFADNGEPTITTWRSRACGACHQHNTEAGHDACLGTLTGVANACCGHGKVSEAYAVLDSGERIEGSRVFDLARADGLAMVEMGERLIACRRWEWLGGMAAWDALGNVERIPDDHEDARAMVSMKAGLHGFCLPVLDDHAFMGCLTSMIRKAYGDDTIVIEHDDDVGWYPWGRTVGVCSATDDSYPTEVLAGIATLEAAP